MKRRDSERPLERRARTMFRETARVMTRLERTAPRAVVAAAEAMIASLRAGGRIYFCGNGGSAADAQHMACELAGRFMIDRPGMAAVALTTNTSSLTAIGNDYGYEQVFSRQLEGLGRPGDVLVAITTSGRSKSVIEAVEMARKHGLVVIGMTGLAGASFAALCDHALVTPHAVTPRVQEGHVAMMHALCALVEESMFPPSGARSGGASRPVRRSTARSARSRRSPPRRSSR